MRPRHQLPPSWGSSHQPRFPRLRFKLPTLGRKSLLSPSLPSAVLALKRPVPVSWCLQLRLLQQPLGSQTSRRKHRPQAPPSLCLGQPPSRHLEPQAPSLWPQKHPDLPPPPVVFAALLQAQPRRPQCLGWPLLTPLSSLSLPLPAPAQLSASSVATQPAPPQRPPCLGRWPPAPPPACLGSRRAAWPAQRPPRHRSAARGSAVLPLAPPPQGSSDSRVLGRPRPSGSRPAAPQAAFPSVSLGSALCLLLVSPCPPPLRPPAGMSSVPLRAPVAPAPSHLDSRLPTTEVGCLARTTLLLLVRVLALVREAPCLVAPRPPPQQRHPLALASVKLQVLGLATLALCLVKQPVPVEQSSASRPLPVAVCLGLETLEEGEASSAASEENPARMQPTKTHSARPAGALGPQLPQIHLTCSETVEPRHLADLPAHHLETRSLLALSALVEEAWPPKALGFPLRIKQVASVLLQCLAALLLLGDPLGLEGCQHSVQPQPLQALWARREAKCSERALLPPAREDSGSGAAATPRRLAPSPARTHQLSDRCPSSLLGLGARAADSQASDQAEEDSPLDLLTRLSRALVAGEAEWVLALLSIPVTRCVLSSPSLRNSAAVL